MGYIEISTLISIFLFFFCFNLDNLISGGKIFEEPTFQYIEYKPSDSNNQSTATSVEQLISSAKYNNKSKIK